MTIPVSVTDGVILRLPPLQFQSPVSLPDVTEGGETDEDDPMPEFDEEYLEGESEDEDESEE